MALLSLYLVRQAAMVRAYKMVLPFLYTMLIRLSYQA